MAKPKFSDAAVLRFIEAQPKSTRGRIARHFGVTKTRVNNCLRRLKNRKEDPKIKKALEARMAALSEEYRQIRSAQEGSHEENYLALIHIQPGITNVDASKVLGINPKTIPRYKRHFSQYKDKTISNVMKRHNRWYGLRPLYLLIQTVGEIDVIGFPTYLKRDKLKMRADLRKLKVIAKTDEEMDPLVRRRLMEYRAPMKRIHPPKPKRLDILEFCTRHGSAIVKEMKKNGYAGYLAKLDYHLSKNTKDKLEKIQFASRVLIHTFAILLVMNGIEKRDIKEFLQPFNVPPEFIPAILADADALEQLKKANGMR